jgi:hypothetical protein
MAPALTIARKGATTKYGEEAQRLSPTKPQQIVLVLVLDDEDENSPKDKQFLGFALQREMEPWRALLATPVGSQKQLRTRNVGCRQTPNGSEKNLAGLSFPFNAPRSGGVSAGKRVL